MSKTTLSATEARKEFFALISRVQTPGQHITLTEKGTPKAVILSADEFESWQETLEVIHDFPDLSEDTKRAEREYKAGDYITLDSILAKEGYVLKDGGKRKYGVPSRSPQKRTKRSR